MLARLGVVKNILKGRLYSKRAYVLPANPDCTVYTSTFCVALYVGEQLIMANVERVSKGDLEGYVGCVEDEGYMIWEQRAVEFMVKSYMEMTISTWTGSPQLRSDIEM